jgi:hypothetical protein
MSRFFDTFSVPFRGLWNPAALKARMEFEFRGARVYITGRAKTENGNFHLHPAKDLKGLAIEVDAAVHRQ